MSEGQNLSRALQVIEPILQISPSSVDVFNGDASVKYIMDVHGVPQKLMNNAKELAKIRDAKAQQLKAQQDQQNQAHQADVASKVLPGVAQIQQAKRQQANPGQ